MSVSYPTYVISVDPERVPPTLETAEALDGLTDDAWKRAKSLGRPELRVVYGSSRGGWVLGATKKLLKEFPFTSLDFLGGDRGQRFQSETLRKYVVILRAHERDQAATDLAELLARITNRPEVAMAVCPGFIEEPEFVERLGRNYTGNAAEISLNDAASDDDGICDEYLIAYLKACAEVLQLAKAADLAVLHVTGTDEVDGWEAPATDNPNSQPLYHGTKADLKPGDLIVPGYSSNYGSRKKAAYVYLSATLNAAIWGAELAVGEGRGRIYIVVPTGPFEDDPNLTNKRFAGNPTKSYRTRDALRVVGEVTDWLGHTAEELKAMQDRLEKLKQLGIEAIEE